MAKITTLLLLDWSTVDQLNRRKSCSDKTSPDCPFSETCRPGGAGISGIGSQEPREATEILEVKAVVGSFRPATARKSTWNYARRKRINSAFGRGFESLQLHYVLPNLLLQSSCSELKVRTKEDLSPHGRFVYKETSDYQVVPRFLCI